jgi:hypothetical protein
VRSLAIVWVLESSHNLLRILAGSYLQRIFRVLEE